MATSNGPLSSTEFLALFDAGAQVLDARGGPDWAASHLRGSIFIGLSPMFPRWVEVLLDANQNWIVIADPGHEGHVFECLGELGYQQIGGYLEGGHASLLAHPERLIRTERVDQAALANELEADQPPHLIDVRQPHEWHAGRIAEAPNIPLTEFEKRCEEVPKDSRIILQCQGGYRSLIAASFLERAGFEDVVDMSGGFGAWVNAGRAVNSAQ